MTTIRVANRKQFVVIEQATIRDQNLSLRARGLLVTLLSYPDDWRINSADLARHVKEGRGAIRACLSELETAGYLTRSKCQIARGRWITDLVLRETPGRTDDRFPVVGQPVVGQPVVGQPVVGQPVAITKTVTKDCEDENSATRDTGAVDNVVKISEEDLEAINSARVRAIIAKNALKE